MKYLLRRLNKIKSLLADKSIFLFLDYDGTLTPIKTKPKYAHLTNRTKNILSTLSKTTRCKLVIISGRSLKDITRMVGLKNVIYCGNHGLEIRGPKIRFSSPVSRKHKSTIQKINHQLHSYLSPIKGVLIENKRLSLSIHYRLVSPENRLLIKNIIGRITAPYLSRNEINIRAGKMVLEIRPPVNWDKGKAVLWLLHNMPFSKNTSVLPAYIGDDSTDEDAFKILKKSGLTVFVGRPKKTNAQYYVKDTSEVLNFLRLIIESYSLGL